MEIVFPIPEACVSAVMVMTQAVVQAVFLAVPVDVVGYSWMNYSLCICPAVCAVLLLSLKLTYRRYDMDETEHKGVNHVSTNSAEASLSLSKASGEQRTAL
jgi:hypothetical protein